jgi:methylmalonyl-CoA/ethylmalonyl-CoA epimerase
MTDKQSLAGSDATNEAGVPTIHQVAWIVPDLDAGVAQMQKVMGWGPWEVYDYAPPRLHDLTVRGQPAEFAWTGAETEISPGSYVELLQPVSTSGIFHEWLRARGEGMHHVGYGASSLEEAHRLSEKMISQGAQMLLSAWIDDLYFYYLDTHPMIYEVWAGDLEAVAPVRRIGAPGEA